MPVRFVNRCFTYPLLPKVPGWLVKIANFCLLQKVVGPSQQHCFVLLLTIPIMYWNIAHHIIFVIARAKFAFVAFLRLICTFNLSLSLTHNRRGPLCPPPSVHVWQLVSRGQQQVYCCPCGVRHANISEDGLDIASNSGLKGDRVTDLCGTATLGGQVCPREVWLHVQTVSCDDGRLDPVALAWRPWTSRVQARCHTWSAGVWRTKLRSTWASTALQLLPSAADIHDQPTSISWLYRAVGRLHLAVGLSLLQARQSGTHYRPSFVVCLSVLVTRRTLKTILFARY